MEYEKKLDLMEHPNTMKGKTIKSIDKMMLSYCLKCKKNTDSKNPRVKKNENNAFLEVCSVK